MKNAIYAQSGGVSSVINASACGVIQTVRKHRDKIGKLYAGEFGIQGILSENIIDTSFESKEAINALRYTPSAVFGSCRYKMKSIEENQVECDRLIDVLDAHNIGYFIYNGGGDSADTCYKVAQIAKKANYPLSAVLVPKTIDNDLPITDNCPGYGSVAKYISTSILEASFDVASMCKTSTKVFILEVMGRNAGWIAAAGGLLPKHIPVVILFPEILLDIKSFLAKVKHNVEQFGYCSILVSEGVKWQNGRFLSDRGTADDFGHIQLGGAAPIVADLVKNELGYKYHWAVADYLQRSARHLASFLDVKQAYEVGVKAVEFALNGHSGVMPYIKRLSNDPYQYSIEITSLKKVANVEKLIPRKFISDDGFGITQACYDYIKPLIQGEYYPPFVDGIPNYTVFKKKKINKKLAEFNLSL